ncbi:MAG: hypothetical protein KIG42_08020 [Paludibacteraceae bacterium]|nr:hypothetical protein [Paludibacteraceae bacterium]
MAGGITSHLAIKQFRKRRFLMGYIKKNKNETPCQYFIRVIDDPNTTNYIAIIRSKELLNYLMENKEKCKDGINKLQEILTTHKKQKVREAAYKVLIAIDEEKYNCLRPYIYSRNPDKKNSPKIKSYKSKIYNAPVGDFGFCCEEEKMAILFSHIKEKNWDNFKIFKNTFSSRYRYDASLLDDEKMKKLYKKYYDYAVNGKIKTLQKERKARISSSLPKELNDTLYLYNLRYSRADGRGTSKVVTKCRRKKQYDKDRLSGFRILSKYNGKVIAGKNFELYENDVKDFCDKLLNGEIKLPKEELKDNL